MLWTESLQEWMIEMNRGPGDICDVEVLWC
jgi:hypothetical protein